MKSSLQAAEIGRATLKNAPNLKNTGTTNEVRGKLGEGTP
jgi:hypothetical protein